MTQIKNIKKSVPHSNRDRLEELLKKSQRQLIDSNYISQELGISKAQAGQLLKEYINTDKSTAGVGQ